MTYYALQKGAQSKLRTEEFVDNTEQRPNDAVAMGVTTEHKTVEFASNMGPRSNYAITPVDVQIMPRREENVSNMAQRSNVSCVVVMDVPTLLNVEECALGMEQNPNNAEPWDVPIKLFREEYAEDTGQRKNRNCVPTLGGCVPI